MFYPTELSTDEYLNDQVIWADYGDFAEDTWSDDDDDDFDNDEEAGEWWNGMAEDAAMEAGLFGWDA